MSNKRVGTALPGYYGPLFPKGLSELQQKAYDCNGGHLRYRRLYKSFERLSVFRQFVVKRTKDNYLWFHAAEFKVGSSTILILIPWCQDFDFQHGTTSDRHMAIYTKEPPQHKDIKKLLSKLHTLWNKSVCPWNPI